MKLTEDDKTLREKINKLHIHMFQVAHEMEHFGDEATQAKAKELYGASEICKEWSEKAMVKNER